MGQSLTLFGYSSQEEDEAYNAFTSKLSTKLKTFESFPDLKLLPPEIGLKILSNVDARELRLCRAFWEDLVNDDLLWKRLCYISWGYCTAYTTPHSGRGPHFWKSLYNTLESATDSFNTYITDNDYSGMFMFQSMGILNDDPNDLAEFLLSTETLKTSHVLAFLQKRQDVLEVYLCKHDFTGWFLPIAMRSFFFKLNLSARTIGSFLGHIFEIFSKHYVACNPSFSQMPVKIVMLSLVMLSNDLRNPSIKNKMSKREYIKNTFQALDGQANGPIDAEYLGHAYDNVYLLGHVAPERLDGL